MTRTLGTQTWMTEDLRTRKLNDGTPIPYISASDQSGWDILSSPAFCLGHLFPLESHPEEECDVLYNWQCVNTGKLCPVGWHVPTDSDWEVLRNYVSNNSVVTRFETVQWIHCDIPVTQEFWFFCSLYKKLNNYCGSTQVFFCKRFFKALWSIFFSRCFLRLLWNGDSLKIL